ncbi:hypothetical protein THOM_2939 [Trachipleistophora hominis]|uniref:Uncharacterized protein n=1 Tax=Trachipleistophora hominis TaxID=72359 RepID=L7JSB2_TRAHO|nr:hypothetical protein THOM_2939 [Trachipleistophora hominis]
MPNTLKYTLQSFMKDFGDMKKIYLKKAVNQHKRFLARARTLVKK